jgi:hypothetical protein
MMSRITNISLKGAALAALLTGMLIPCSAWAASKLTVTGNISVPAGREFVLDASADGGDDGVTFSWKETKGPVKLRLPNQGLGKTLKLTANWVGKYVFTCTAVFPGGAQETATTKVLVTRAVTVPSAVISGELVRKAGAGQWVFLSGEESSDPAGRKLIYKWSQVSGPTAKVREGTYEKPVLEFLPDAPGRYVFALQVEAGRERSEAVVVIVEVPSRPDGSADHPAVLSVEYPENAARGRSFVMSADKTVDPDGDKVTLSWELIDAPAQKGFSASGPSIEFVPMESGMYRFIVKAESAGLVSSKEITVRVTGSPVAAAQPRPEKGLSVSFRTEGLDNVLVSLSRSFGIAVRIDPRWINPAGYSSMLVDLNLNDVSEELLVTAIARIVGGHYHIEGGHAYWIERGYSFLNDEKKEPISVPVSGKDETADMSRFLEETIKPAVISGGGKLGDSNDGRSVVGMLPASAVRRIEKILTIAAAPVLKSGVSAVKEPVLTAFSKTVNIKGDKLFIRDIIWDVARQADVNIGFRPADLPEAGLKAVTINEGPVQFDAALKRILALTGLKSYRIDSPNMIWLFAEDPGLAGPNLWDASQEAAFDVSNLVRKNGVTGSLIEHLIKKRVAAATWLDPATAVVYLPARERLIVVNHPYVIGLIESFLSDLDRTSSRYFSLEE